MNLNTPLSETESFEITNLPTYNSNHHSTNEFFNPVGEPQPPRPEKTSFGTSMKFFFGAVDVSSKFHAPLRPIPPEEFHQGPGVRFWWIGHATCLFQLGETFILTDPIFTNYASPIAGMFKRLVPPACQISDLPPISYCLLSHNHYDHLDYPSIKELNKRFPEMIILTGLKMSQLIGSWGPKVIEFDWRQQTILPTSPSIKLTCMPAYHFSTRKGYDSNQYLWVSFLIEYKNIIIYFPGDTAIGPHFNEVAELSGKPIDLVSMPVGPKEPVKMMRSVHVDAEDALQMSDILKAKTVVPIHWGVFPLGLEPEIPDIDAISNCFHNVNQDHRLKKLKVGGVLEWNSDSQAFQIIENSDSLID